MNRVLVTGGAGYIGSHTVRALINSGAHVVVVDNLSEGHRAAIVDSNVDLVVGNINDTSLMTRVFHEYTPDGVIHFAASAYVGESVREPLKYYDNNVASVISLLQVMKNHSCRHFVFSSTCATYGEPEMVPISEDCIQNPINPYGRSKLMVEKILHDCESAWGLHSICLRYFNAAGCSSDTMIGEDHDPETHLIPRILKSILGQMDGFRVFGTDYKTPDGTCVRDYIHVEDLANAHLLALKYLESGGGSEKINLGTGQGLSILQVIQLAESVSGKKCMYKIGARRAGDPAELIADPSKAHKVLGWKAQKTPKEIIQSSWDWFSAAHGGRYEQCDEEQH